MKKILLTLLVSSCLSALAYTNAFVVVNTNGFLVWPTSLVGWSNQINAVVSSVGSGVTASDFNTATNNLQTQIDGLTSGSGISTNTFNILATNNYLSFARSNIVIPYAYPLIKSNAVYESGVTASNALSIAIATSNATFTAGITATNRAATNAPLAAFTGYTNIPIANIARVSENIVTNLVAGKVPWFTNASGITFYLLVVTNAP